MRSIPVSDRQQNKFVMAVLHVSAWAGLASLALDTLQFFLK
jgi:hypothetical protein